ncbi:MAG: secretin and TonB N-terminal domain-containing protein [Halanaerobiales bacterium]|nr:secretin and TonB N-terminal domain-containing protein [Halanaerobiales bacterium]
MNKNNKKIALILLLTLITVSFYSFTLSAAVQGEIKDMNFKGADIRDVFRAIAEVAGVNLVTDSSVTGNITIHLREISFDEALNLITQTTGLAYKWDGNTVVVATPQRIEEVYAKKSIEIIRFDNKNLERVRSVVSSIYLKLNIQITRENKEILLVGNTEDINGAMNLIDKVDFPDVVY